MRPILLTLAFVLLPAEARVQPAAAAPNIVLIMSDDMGFSDIGCYGGEINTPNLDRLASGGLRFTQFYNGARCCPTRASLLTGVYPHQAGMGMMTDHTDLPGYRGDLGRNVMTIAEALGTGGYRCYMTGKWHVARVTNPDGPKDNWPLQRGFDKFYGTITGAGSYYDPTTLCSGNRYITPVNDPDYKPATYYYTDAISDHAVKFLSEHAKGTPDKPFFLYVAYTAAHWPMHALPQDIAKYKGRYDKGFAAIREQRFKRLKAIGLLDQSTELSPQANDWEQVRDKAWEARNMEVYAAMVDRMDQGIAEAYRGKLERQPGHLIDIMATCVDLGGVAYPQKFAGHDVLALEGVSLRPAFTGKPLGRNDAIYFEHHLNCAIRDGQWKLVRKEGLGKGPKILPWELYDMSKDRSELHDLAARHPEKCAELSAKWDAWAVRALVKPWPWKIEANP
jgi:arylsulfatase A-like enzyme